MQLDAETVARSATSNLKFILPRKKKIPAFLASAEIPNTFFAVPARTGKLQAK